MGQLSPVLWDSFDWNISHEILDPEHPIGGILGREKKLEKKFNQMANNDKDDGQSRSSRVHRFIVVLEKASDENVWKDTALEEAGVPVRRLQLHVKSAPFLVQLTTTSAVKFRGVELCRRLLASEEFAGVQRVLTASGDTKDEFKELEAQYFPVQRREAKRDKSDDVQVVLKEKVDVVKERVNVVKERVDVVKEKSDGKNQCQIGDQVEQNCAWKSTGLSWMLSCKSPEAPGTTGEKTEDVAGQNMQLVEEIKQLAEQNKALLEQNETLAQQNKTLTQQNKKLAKDNAHWMERKASFDRLTLCYAEWRFDLKTKDDEIARLKGENATLAKELALMTERRDTLMRRAAV